MIEKLYVRNYAIIEELEIHFSDKLTIITGETGAGKSILLGALGLITGNRADSKVLFNKEQKCIIEGVFKIRSYDLRDFFDQNDIDYDEQAIIRRELTPSGKSRAFINDTPVNLTVLKELASELVDIHHQFDTLDIHNVSFQVRTLDALAGNQKLMESYQQNYKSYKRMVADLTALTETHINASKEIDFLNFQLTEFEESNLVQDEQSVLEEEQKTLSSSEQIKSVFMSASQVLSENDDSTINRVSSISNEISQLREVNSTIDDLWKRLDSLLLELQDLSGEFQNLADSTQHDGTRIKEIEDRLNLIYRLQNKHHVNSVAELLQIRDDLEKRISSAEDLSAQISNLESELSKKESELYVMAEELSAKRRQQVDSLEQDVQDLLSQLAMPYSQIKVEVDQLSELNSTGIDQVRFLFSPNKGSDFEMIKNVASGGELSRLTLCIKSLVASAIPLPSLIFDEIDSGISGDVALKMGKILNDLSKEHQVVTITHTPQIAAKADKHYYIFKKVDGDRTLTNVKELNKEERIVEIATMLSGSPPSESAVENAQDLLKR